MSLSKIKFGFTLFELAEAIEPDVEKVIATAAAKGGKPTVRDEWPAIRDALDKAVAGPAGDIRL